MRKVLSSRVSTSYSSPKGNIRIREKQFRLVAVKSDPPHGTSVSRIRNRN